MNPVTTILTLLLFNFSAGAVFDTDLKPFLKVFRNFAEVCETRGNSFLILSLFSEYLIAKCCNPAVLFADYISNVPKGKSFPQKTPRTDKKQKFIKQVREASTFTDMATHLEEMITWCKSQKMEKEKRLLTFLLLKCQRMKCLEAAGYK